MLFAWHGYAAFPHYPNDRTSARRADIEVCVLINTRAVAMASAQLMHRSFSLFLSFVFAECAVFN